MADGDRFRILSLDGGGAKGVFSIGVLKEVEAHFGSKLSDHFDLVYGTSTGAIIASLIALGKNMTEIEALYLSKVPAVMSKHSRWTRTSALRQMAPVILEGATFKDCRCDLGIVATNLDQRKPLIFKTNKDYAHGLQSTFQPGFGLSMADALIASTAAFPFFEKVKLELLNQGPVTAADGGFVANNPTLLAIADVVAGSQRPRSSISVLSVGVGSYPKPRRILNPLQLILHTFGVTEFIEQMFDSNTNTIESLRGILFKDVPTVRIDQAHVERQYECDLLESDVTKLKQLISLGRTAFGGRENSFKEIFGG